MILWAERETPATDTPLVFTAAWTDEEGCLFINSFFRFFLLFSPLADVGSIYAASAVRASVAQPRVLRAEVFGNTRTILYRFVVTFPSR